MKWIVNGPDGYATNLREFKGTNLTLYNQSGVDIYFEVGAVAQQLNASAPGVVPVGTKLVATTGFIQFFDAPDNIWVRAVSQTVLDVQADAINTDFKNSKVPCSGHGRFGATQFPGNTKITIAKTNKKSSQVGPVPIGVTTGGIGPQGTG